MHNALRRWLAGVLIFSLVPAAPAAEPIDYFGSLQQRLIADGLEETMIRSLYARPEVKFETLGI